MKGKLGYIVWDEWDHDDGTIVHGDKKFLEELPRYHGYTNAIHIVYFEVEDND